MAELTSEQRRTYTEELTRDRAKPWDPEFRRTCAAERRILDTHEEAGLRFLLSRKGIEAGWAPGCPWPDEKGAPAQDVRRLLGPLREWMPAFVGLLEARVRWVTPVRLKSAWRLAYVTDWKLHDGQPYWQLILGGAPNAGPELASRPGGTGWTVPASLAHLYAVHDGLGPDDGCRSILRSEELTDLGEMMDPIAAEQHFVPDGYQFKDLLEFSRDGAGNSQCFWRRRAGDQDPLTVDWDHETREISRESPFFTFADRLLASAVEDEE